jgi:hypothetical protein
LTDEVSILTPGKEIKGASVKLNVYGMNLDGVHRAIVAAPSKKKAAELFGTTLGQLNNYGGRSETETEVALALSEPGAVWYRKMEYGPKADLEWRRERTTRRRGT